MSSCRFVPPCLFCSGLETCHPRHVSFCGSWIWVHDAHKQTSVEVYGKIPWYGSITHGLTLEKSTFVLMHCWWERNSWPWAVRPIQGGFSPPRNQAEQEYTVWCHSNAVAQQNPQESLGGEGKGWPHRRTWRCNMVGRMLCWQGVREPGPCFQHHQHFKVSIWNNNRSVPLVWPKIRWQTKEISRLVSCWKPASGFWKWIPLPLFILILAEWPGSPLFFLNTNCLSLALKGKFNWCDNKSLSWLIVTWNHVWRTFHYSYPQERKGSQIS